VVEALEASAAVVAVAAAQAAAGKKIIFKDRFSPVFLFFIKKIEHRFFRLNRVHNFLKSTQISKIKSPFFFVCEE
jgi:hypothetical protein